MQTQNLFLDSIDEILWEAGHVELDLFTLVYGLRGVVAVGAIAIAFHVKVFYVDG